MYRRRAAVIVFVVAIVAALASLPMHDDDASVTGIVTDDHGPVAGAVVRWQGTALCTRTDVDGRFRLGESRKSRPLTAAKPGRVIAAGSARQTRLQMLPLPADDHDDYAWIDPSPDSSQPLQCANCHAQIHDEWSRSAHGNSAKNRKFLHMFAGTDGMAPPSKTWNLREEHPLGSGVCAVCHAPTLTSPDLDYDLREARGVHAHGVHCDYCHKIAEAPTDKLGTRFGRDGYRLLRPADKEQLFFGPLDDAVRTGESFVYAPFYKESRYCASCHEGIVFGVHVYGTYSEWLESPARRQGRQCQDCHMAPTGKMTNFAPGKGGVERDPQMLASHVFPGATEGMLKQCVEVKAKASRSGQGIAVEITVTAKQVGHRVPTGFIDRHLILVVDAEDSKGKPQRLSEGAVLPLRAGGSFAGRPGWIYGKQHLDAAGVPLPFWRTAEVMPDTRLAPEQPDRRRFVFRGEASRVRVRVLYRRFWAEVASPREWADNEVSVCDTFLGIDATEKD